MDEDTRKNIFETLKIDEGVEYEIYKDHLGYSTFGVGHLVLKTDEEYGFGVGTPVSTERVQECFDRDLDISIRECYTLYGERDFEDLPNEVKEILVNMMFNLGRPRLTKFKNFNSAISEGDWSRASIEGRDSLWYRQVTNRAERLMTRMENVN